MGVGIGRVTAGRLTRENRFRPARADLAVSLPALCVGTRLRSRSSSAGPALVCRRGLSGAWPPGLHPSGFCSRLAAGRPSPPIKPFWWGSQFRPWGSVLAGLRLTAPGRYCEPAIRGSAWSAGLLGPVLRRSALAGCGSGVSLTTCNLVAVGCCCLACAPSSPGAGPACPSVVTGCHTPRPVRAVARPAGWPVRVPAGPVGLFPGAVAPDSTLRGMWLIGGLPTLPLKVGLVSWLSHGSSAPWRSPLLAGPWL